MQKVHGKNSFIKEGLLVVDGDWLAFKVASVLENKFIQVYDEGVVKAKFKNRTLYKKSKDFNENFEIRDCQTLKKDYLKTMKYLFADLISSFKIRTGCNEVLIALGGPSNFRDSLPLFQKYKGNREGLIKPLALKETREVLAETYPTVYSVDEEADDIISKYQYTNFINPDKRIVVCTLDKDARGTPGLLYIPDKDTLLDIEGLGFLEVSKTKQGYKAYGIGRKWFYYQLIHGDSADNYYPCYLHRQMTGNTSKSPVMTDLKTFNLFKDCNTDEECIKAVVSVYKDWYGDLKEWEDWSGKINKGTWVDILQCYIDVVHMRRWDNDRVDVRKLLDRFGIEYA